MTCIYHHHLLWKFLPHSPRVRCLPQYEVSPHILEHCPFRLQTKQFHVIIYTLPTSSPCPCTSPSPLPTSSPAPTFLPSPLPTSSPAPTFLPSPLPTSLPLPLHFSPALSPRLSPALLFSPATSNFYPLYTINSSLSKNYYLLPMNSRWIVLFMGSHCHFSWCNSSRFAIQPYRKVLWVERRVHFPRDPARLRARIEGCDEELWV